MKKICVVCGKEFESKTDRAKYCCVVCKNHSRFKRTRSEWHQKKEDVKNRIIFLYHEGKNDKQIADEIEKSISYVQQTRYSLGFKKQLTDFQKEVKELRLRGLCSVEIADVLGKDSKLIRQTANRIGMPFTEEEKQKSIDLGKMRATKTRYGVCDRADVSRQYIKKNCPDFEYISGFINSDGFMKVRCRICNSEFVKSAISIRHCKKIMCPACQENERLRKKQEVESERKRQQEKRAEEKKFEIFKKEFQQESFKRCECCGSLFFGNNRKYCSSECAKKILNKTHSDKRIKKMRAVVVDSNITLEKLYQRDYGTCWLCGGQCDWNDYQRTEEGYFIVGKNYPSIDHVKPLAKGGLHSWINVKLAHHYCNTLKNDKVVCL